MKKIWGNCEYTDGCIYTSLPPKVKCTITNKFHFENDVCDVKFAPVKCGQWIDGKCSECGCFKPIKEMTCNGSIMWTLKGEMNYCPNCGAKMEDREW